MKFLCAFIVGMPIATTCKGKEIMHVRELLRAVRSDMPPSNEEGEEISDRAIDCILQQASEDPENRAILRVPAPRNKMGTRLLTFSLTIGFFVWLNHLVFGNKESEGSSAR